MSNKNIQISRRNLLKTGAGMVMTSLLPSRVYAEASPHHQIMAAPASVQLSDGPFPKTDVWACNGQVPGTLLRVKQGDPLWVRLKNQLPQPLTLHWHGLRIPNAMDGVPMLTQKPVMPGETFDYRFSPPDAGTYWYHSHVNTAEQIGRGVYGPLIVDEHEPPVVDRDLVWVLDDWRLDSDAQIVNDFDNHRDFARAGRLGNTITVNGKVPTDFQVKSGERIRLRLINTANARIFSLRFQGLNPQIIAHDGQPVSPREPVGGNILLAPAQRIDLILDVAAGPGERLSILDTYYPQAPFLLRDIVVADSAPIRENLLDTPIALPRNPIQKPQLNAANRKDVVLKGGDLGDMDSAQLRGESAGLARLVMMGKMWAMNGSVGYSMDMPPMFEFKRGETVVLNFKNESAWPHPMHLHGHNFEVIEHSGSKENIGLTLDTVLLGPGENSSVAFVADNPGKWLFHCHILGHAAAGMIAVFKVS